MICPNCHSTSIAKDELEGMEGQWFARLKCLHCREYAFFQIDLPQGGLPWGDHSPEINSTGQLSAEEASSPLWTQGTETILQSEWNEWLDYKKRYVDKDYQSVLNRKAPRRIAARWNIFLFAFMILGTLFFIVDQYHLLGLIGENIVARQTIIDQYSQKLSKSTCLSIQMKAKVRTVPILYTSESVFRKSSIQYGETGHYWGQIQIKIHRSNFWFFGWPKKSQLIDTLIHEARHRASPNLAHSPNFYQLVDRDHQCVLKNWDL